MKQKKRKKDILEQGIKDTKELFDNLPKATTAETKRLIIEECFLDRVIDNYGKRTWKINDKKSYVEFSIDCILKNLPITFQKPTEKELVDYCNDYFRFFINNYEGQYMPNGIFTFKSMQLAYNQTLKTNPNCLKSLTFKGANSHIKITDKEINLLKKYLPSETEQKEVIHTLFYIASNNGKKIFGLGRKDYIFNQIKNITGLQFESN